MAIIHGRHLAVVATEPLVLASDVEDVVTSFRSGPHVGHHCSQPVHAAVDVQDQVAVDVVVDGDAHEAPALQLHHQHIWPAAHSVEGPAPVLVLARFDAARRGTRPVVQMLDYVPVGLVIVDGLAH